MASVDRPVLGPLDSLPPAVDWRTIRALDCELSVRARNAISDSFSPTTKLGWLADQDDDVLLRSADIGRRTLNEIREMIEIMKAAYPLRIEPPVFIPTAETDWSLLGRAVEFYKARGYTYVEVPWAVSESSVAITCPNPQFTARVDHLGSLVGSAEQSLLHLDLAGKLAPGSYVACSPCFRLGDAADDLHFPTFMKVELYRNDHDLFNYLKMLKDAGDLFRELGAAAMDLAAPQDDRGIDITLGGIEIGSYGLRTHESEDRSLHHWAYGTGLALPRFSQALARCG